MADTTGHETAYFCADVLGRLLRREGPVSLSAEERLRPLTGQIKWSVGENGELTVWQDDDAVSA